MRSFILLLCLAAVAPMAGATDPVSIEVSSPHFTLVTDAGEKQARHILDNFERMRWMFQTLFPKMQVDPPTPIIVIAAKNRREFESVEPAEYLAKGRLNLAGYFLTTNDRNYILMRLDAESEHPYATVYHEYTHMQFRGAMEWMPLWLNEGMAEFYQNTEFNDKDVVLGQPSVDDIVYLRQHALIPLATLLRVDHNSPYYHEEEKGSVFYAEAWALTHYLEVSDSEKSTHRLYDYAVRMNRHEDSVTAAQNAFGDLRQLQMSLQSYIAGAQYKQFVLNSAAAQIDAASYKVRTLSPMEFKADRADVLAHVGRLEEARASLEEILATDKTLPGPRDTMAFLAWRNGDQAAALDWYKQAVELGTRDYFAYFHVAQMSISLGAAQDGTLVEKNFRKAIELNPAFAPSYDELAGWYARNNQNLDTAEQLEQKAIELEPNNFYFRLNAANVLLMREKYDEAEHMLKLAGTLAKTPDEKAMVDNRLETAAATRASLTVMSTVRERGDGSATSEVDSKVVTIDTPPKHPVEPATGPKHTVIGILRGVQCAYPTYLEMQVRSKDDARMVKLYSSNFAKIELSALGFDAGSEINPCQDIEGLTAKVVYAESSDHTIDGQIISIELHKR